MNLPVVLDIAIGLIFVYLIASLLASEIQELIATILQWRAKHLRESIENLLAGGHGTREADQLSDFVESIYNDPLIKTINQDAKGLIGSLGKWVYRNVFYRKSIFGNQTTAPSYIPPETFATALLDQLGMSILLNKLIEIRLKKFISRVVGSYETDEYGRVLIPDEYYFQDKDNFEKGGIRVLAEKAKSLGQEAYRAEQTEDYILNLSRSESFRLLVEDYDDAFKDFKSSEVDLETCIERIREGLELYINQISEEISVANEQITEQIERSSDQVPDRSITQNITLGSPLFRKQFSYFKKRLNSFKLSIFGERSERAILSGRLNPSLLEIAEFFDRSSATFQEIEVAYRDISDAYRASTKPELVRPVLDAIAARVSELVTTNRQGMFQFFGETSLQSITCADLLKEEYQSYVDEALTTLSVEEKNVFLGWKTYQQIILTVVTTIAGQLQQQERLFDGDREVTQPLDALSEDELKRVVDQSLNKLSNEDRRLSINAALMHLQPKQRQVYWNYESYQEIQKLLSRVPSSIRQSLPILAKRAQTKFQQTDKQLNQVVTEVAVWFDRSMSRASGVYKRNAKGVALMIGFLIAVISNTDSFHVISRLSGDEDLRQVVTQRASEITQTMRSEELTKERLRELKDETDSILQEISLPIRWTPANLRQQFGCPMPKDESVDTSLWSSFYSDCLSDQSATANGFNPLKIGEIASSRLVDTGRLFLGWIVSGVAIAMGSPFWFDLLSKVMNVRNTGAKPSPVADSTRKSAD